MSSRPTITIVEIWTESEPPWDARGVPWIVRMLVRWAITIVAFLVAEWTVNLLFSGDPFYLSGWQAIVFAPAIFVVITGVPPAAADLPDLSRYRSSRSACSCSWSTRSS